MYKTLYIINYIGINSGMHYYDESFVGELSSYMGIDVLVLSNYSTAISKKSFFPNIFEGKKIYRIFKLLFSYISLTWIMLYRKKSHFIIYNYGGPIDILFLSLTVPFSSKITVDIHDLYGLDEKSIIKRWCIDFFYKHFVKSVIIHAKKTRIILEKTGYEKKIFETPHFKYRFRKQFSPDLVDKNIRDTINSANDRKKILFFGHIRLSKGIDILSQAFCFLPENIQEKYSIIIAGKDTSGIIQKLEISKNKYATSILRVINDDELVYLFSNCDYVILPYREISQSGVLEMAFYFRKPVLASNLPYFERVFSECPSFGLLFDNTCDGICNMFLSLETLSNEFYSECDVAQYEQRDKIKAFLGSFVTEILKINNNKVIE